MIPKRPLPSAPRWSPIGRWLSRVLWRPCFSLKAVSCTQEGSSTTLLQCPPYSSKVVLDGGANLRFEIPDRAQPNIRRQRQFGLSQVQPATGGTALGGGQHSATLPGKVFSSRPAILVDVVLNQRLSSMSAIFIEEVVYGKEKRLGPSRASHTVWASCEKLANHETKKAAGSRGAAAFSMSQP